MIRPSYQWHLCHLRTHFFTKPLVHPAALPTTILSVLLCLVIFHIPTLPSQMLLLQSIIPSPSPTTHCHYCFITHNLLCWHCFLYHYFCYYWLWKSWKQKILPTPLQLFLSPWLHCHCCLPGVLALLGNGAWWYLYSIQHDKSSWNEVELIESLNSNHYDNAH